MSTASQDGTFTGRVQDFASNVTSRRRAEGWRTAVIVLLLGDHAGLWEIHQLSDVGALAAGHLESVAVILTATAAIISNFRKT